MYNKKPSLIFDSLSNIAPYSYFFIAPLIIAFILISFEFSFYGILSTTQASTISTAHKILNDFFALCTWITSLIIAYSYFFIGLDAAAKQQLKQHIRALPPKQQSMYKPLGIIFFIFIVLFLNLNWFFISNDLPARNSKGYLMAYLLYHAPKYLSLIFSFLQYSFIIFLTLMLFNALEGRKIK
ncbi:hypothetical protein [Acinetobacter sp. NS-4]|uniref:hypothetical protein n=1 Tax=Acinetobacter sp. NS-4 TaxID=3127956 RepID=UPI00307E3119